VRLLLDARYLVLGVTNTYRHNPRDRRVSVETFREAKDQLDAVYASDRLQLPFQGLLLFGYWAGLLGVAGVGEKGRQCPAQRRLFEGFEVDRRVCGRSISDSCAVRRIRGAWPRTSADGSVDRSAIEAGRCQLYLGRPRCWWVAAKSRDDDA
jgi:hypothetical protein